MSEENKVAITLKSLLDSDNVKARFIDVLGKQANTYMSSIMSAVNSSNQLKIAEPMSIVQSGMMAATLNLPVNQNLGFAYMVPYKQNYKDADGKWQNKMVCQFQIGYKGLIQLAQRSGQFRTINASDVREGEIKSINRLTGDIVFEWLDKDREKAKIIGFVGFFELLNGFSKSMYMSVEDLKKHGMKYSQSYKSESSRASSLWETAFETMSIKTVLKLLISKYAPLSIEMQRAIISDQGVIKDSETLDIEYLDVDINGKAIPEYETELPRLYAIYEDKFSPEEQLHIQRIIEKKETTSYKKVYDKLKQFETK